MNNAFSKMVEGFGLVAGLNETNEVKMFVGGSIVEGEYSSRLSVFEFSLFDAYNSLISDIRRGARVDKMYGRETVTHFWKMFEIVIKDRDIAEGYCEDIFFGTEEEYYEKKREERREELESTAKELAAKFKVKLSSLEFIEKLHEAIDGVRDDQEQWNNPERRAEEWAACMYSGGGSDVYYDDLNFENGRYNDRINDYYDILDWLREECPLLMCKYEEMKLKKDDEYPDI